MKVIVDFDLCEANAICMDVAPEVFKVDDNDELQILLEKPPEELRKNPFGCAPARRYPSRTNPAGAAPGLFVLGFEIQRQ